MIKIITSLLLIIPLSITSISSFSNTHYYHKETNNKQNIQSNSNTDVSWKDFNNLIHKDKSIDFNTWAPKNIIDNEINLDYHNIADMLYNFYSKRQDIFWNISNAIDQKWNDDEISIFGNNSVFRKLAMDDYFASKIYFTIKKQNNDIQNLNNNGVSFTKLDLENNNITSYYLRISNNPSMIWDEDNNSYFDVTVNICNFGDSDKNIIDTNNNKNLADKLSPVNTYRDWYQSFTGTTFDTQSDIIIKLTDICPQFTNLKIASYFLDYSYFFINPSTWFHTYDHGNQNTNPYHNDPKENQNYYFNLDTLSKNWTKENSDNTSQYHTYTAKSKENIENILPSSVNRFHYYYGDFWKGECYITSYTHIWNDNFDSESKDNTLNNSTNFHIKIFTTSTLKGHASRGWDFGCSIIDAKLELHINKNIFNNV